MTCWLSKVFQKIWQLLCCWYEYGLLYSTDFLWSSELQISQLSVLRIANFTTISSKIFMWCGFFDRFPLWRAFCNALPSFCGSICLDGYLRFLPLKFSLWRALYFLSTKVATSFPNPQELWNPFNSLGSWDLTFASVRENEISFLLAI